jgi:hypothetical protein
MAVGDAEKRQKDGNLMGDRMWIMNIGNSLEATTVLRRTKASHRPSNPQKAKEKSLVDLRRGIPVEINYTAITARPQRDGGWIREVGRPLDGDRQAS